MSHQTPASQEDSRLIILVLAPVASIIFALLSLFGGDAWRWLALMASAFAGVLALIVGGVTRIRQMTRRQLNMRNTLIFSSLYFLAWVIFLGSCVSGIESAVD